MAYLGTAWFVFHVATVIGESLEPIHQLMRGFGYLLAADRWMFHRPTEQSMPYTPGPPEWGAHTIATRGN